MTKKGPQKFLRIEGDFSSEIFENRRGFFKFFLECCVKIYFPKIFAPPISVTQIFAPQYL